MEHRFQVGDVVEIKEEYRIGLINFLSECPSIKLNHNQISSPAIIRSIKDKEGSLMSLIIVEFSNGQTLPLNLYYLRLVRPHWVQRWVNKLLK